ncbi:hypothetical protein C8Q80DRAFT_1116624 [Daedaleopsis nitida]|nr:hypothetical protein C8Q80DRAFT_1116624 [Daedaleopsis nitida]
MVQRMPDSVRSRFEKIVRKYLWNDRIIPPVSMEQACASRDSGGLAILDLKSRNEAIDVMWLKDYLSFGPTRATWTKLADDLFARIVRRDCTVPIRDLCVNTFMQDWSPKVSQLPSPLSGILKAAGKFGLRLEAIALSWTILCSMPLWYHAHAVDKPKMRLASRASHLTTCLKETHNLQTVGDFESFCMEFHMPAH